jgi:hypothetical protein
MYREEGDGRKESSTNGSLFWKKYTLNINNNNNNNNQNNGTAYNEHLNQASIKISVQYVLNVN